MACRHVEWFVNQFWMPDMAEIRNLNFQFGMSRLKV
jgi:hypothetical protein